GANNLTFDNPKVLGEISTFISTQPQKNDVKNKEKFKFVRFFNNKETYLDRLQFLDRSGKEITGKIINDKNEEISWKEGAFDNDPLTYSGGAEFSFGLEFEKAQSIGSIRFQARNADNHIRLGDQYELYYWDESWKSLGKKEATDTMLVYNSMPK